MTNAARVRCSCFASRSNSTAPATISPYQRVWRALRSARSCRLHHHGARAHHVDSQVRRRALHVPPTRPAIATCLRRRSPLRLRASACSSSSTRASAAGCSRRQDHRRRRQRRTVAGPCLCRGARKLVAADAQADKAFPFRSIPSKAIRSRCPSSMPMVRRCPP